VPPLARDRRRDVEVGLPDRPDDAAGAEAPVELDDRDLVEAILNRQRRGSPDQEQPVAVGELGPVEVDGGV
jgi:hypothetical protein